MLHPLKCMVVRTHHQKGLFEQKWFQLGPLSKGIQFKGAANGDGGFTFAVDVPTAVGSVNGI